MTDQKSILLTIDTEFYISESEILGINGSHGINDILSVLNEFQIKATFFVDYFVAYKWGHDILKDINAKIAAYGHDIQLHLHPAIVGGKPYLWQYNAKRQTELIDQARQLYRDYNGMDPEYFRAGGYSADNTTLQILHQRHFKADLSFQYRQRRCKIEQYPFINKIFRHYRTLEIPTTVYKYYWPLKRFNSINMEWCSFQELKLICRQGLEMPTRHLIVMMHSFGLMNRYNRERLKPSDYNRRKFKKFIVYALKAGYQFATVSDFLKKESTQLPNTDDFIPTIKSPLAVFSGLILRIRNHFILNRSFRRKSLIWLFIFIILFFLFFYLFAFESIEPSVRRSRYSMPDITAWNRDGDIHTIEYNYLYRPDLHPDSPVDHNGIPYRTAFADQKKYLLPSGVDTFYIPTDMSSGIIYAYNHYLISGDSTWVQKIGPYAGWLFTQAVETESTAVWTHPYGFSKYDLEKNWTGAWAMGSILSALTRYYQITNDPAYFDLLIKATHTFNTTIAEGGILAVDKRDNYWFEEYPTIPKNSVLNGHIHGMLGLYDFWRISGYQPALELFDRGVVTLIDNLNRYDAGYWSYYDLRFSYVADYYYHTCVHIPQLEVLAEITGHPLFRRMAKKWRNYLAEPAYSAFKLSIFYDALHRRLTYKSFFSLGK